MCITIEKANSGSTRLCEYIAFLAPSAVKKRFTAKHSEIRKVSQRKDALSADFSLRKVMVV